jgi:hypothetical protein
MTLKPEVKFDKLFQKLYNVELWLLAYQRIAPKQGNMTPGADGKTIDGAGMKLIQDAITDLKASRYKPVAARRVYIPKANGKQRPLGIPIWAAYCLSFQEMLGITPIASWVDWTCQSTNILILYDIKRLLAMVSLFPSSSNRLAQRFDDLWSQRNPARTVSSGSNELQYACPAPKGNGGDIDIEQICSSLCRVASITSLPSGRSTRAFWTVQRNAVGITDPLDFACRKCTSHARNFPFFVEQSSDLGIGVSGSQFPYAPDQPTGGLAHFPRIFNL